MEVDRQRRQLGGDQRGPAGTRRQDRRRRVARQPGPALRRGGGRARPGRRLPVRRRGGLVAAGERGSHYPHAFLVLHEDLRRPAGRGDGVRHERPVPQVDRRRPHLHPGDGAPRRQPPPLDQPRQRRQHDQLQRRRRERQLQRGRQLVHPAQPAHGAVLPRDHGQPVPLPRLRRPAGQLGDRHAVGFARGDRLGGLLLCGGVRERVSRLR